jgi:predicted RNA-binding Zn ribbon-like protein
LDFANTLSTSSGEHLNTYADLLAFAEESGVLSPEDGARLRTQASNQPARTEAVMERAYTLRAAIFATFSKVAAGRALDAEDLEMLNYEVAAGLARLRVVEDDTSASERSFHWGWSALELDRPLWNIARSAAEVLVSDEDRRRVRECGGAECRWLFLDTSKNRSRQWCSMQSCGNRQKARRHYERVRAATKRASATPR